MFKDTIKRIFGGKDEPPGTGLNAALKACFAYLDQLGAGTADRMVSFIETGAGRTILADLQARKAAVEQALKAARIAEAKKKQPHVTHSHFVPTAESENALPLAVLSSVGDPERIHRLIEAGMAGQLLHGGQYQVYGVKTAMLNMDVVHLFSMAGQTRHSPTPADRHPSFADFMAVATAMNTDSEALLASGLWRNWTHTGLGQYGFEWITSAGVEEFSRALRQHDASMREMLLDTCLRQNIGPTGDMLPLLFDLTDDSAGKVRDLARRLIIASGDDRATGLAIGLLSSGKATQRAVMAQILGDIGSEDAMSALKDRQGIEKTRAVSLLIEQLLDSAGPAQADPGKPGYEAVDGSWITPPEMVMPPDDGARPFGAEDEVELKALAQKEYEADLQRAKSFTGRGMDYKPMLDDSWTILLAAFNGEKSPLLRTAWIYTPWTTKAVKRASDGRLLRLWASSSSDDIDIYSHGSPVVLWLEEQIDAGAMDIRTLIAAVEDVRTWLPDNRRIHGHTPRAEGQSIPDYIMNQLLTGQSYQWQGSTDAALWPLIADYLPLLAQNLPPHDLSATQNMRALRLIRRLPAIPRMLVPALINACTAEARSVRSAAQALLSDLDGITPPILAALGDSRQAIRANAASFLAQRGDSSVLPDLIAALGREKSDLARAAMISAVAALGGDTSEWLGKAALESEAKANAKKLKGDKIDWLAQTTAPLLHWQDGTPVTATLLDGWLKLAVKLKTLEDGAGLFKLYLDQLLPEDRAALGDWILSSWIAHDTYRPPREGIYREQLEAAKAYLVQYKTTGYYKDYTPERLAEEWTRMQLSNYPNSGAAAKGILALALDATPLTQARLTSGYLKNHGKRVAQAKTMIELLALSGTPEALQVVVAVATRFKQRTVREHAEMLVERIAEERGWTPDELADRSVPSGGLDEGGILDLPMGEDAKPYQARLDAGLVLHLHNPDGKAVKALPAGTDENSKESKALLTNAKKVLKEVVAKQSGRFYEAMLSGRNWTPDAWQADLRSHPILGRLTERAIWRGLDGDGNVLVTFRPTAEGDLMTASGDDAALTGVEQIDLAHATALSADELAAWSEHLSDFEVTPLFNQIGRPVLTLSPDQAGADAITDREGWMMDNLKLRGLAGKLGYDNSQAEDGGSITSYEKRIDGLGYRAAINFSGTYFGADSHPVALTELQFFGLGKRSYRPVPLADLPPRLLSECWNDLHDIARSGAYDADWKKKGLW